MYIKKILSKITILVLVLPFFLHGGYLNIARADFSADCSGGTITYSGGKTIHTFNTSSTLVCTGLGTQNVEILVVAGGGGGGFNTGGGLLRTSMTRN